MRASLERLCVWINVLVLFASAGCADRIAGQIELLSIDDGKLQRYGRAPAASRINALPDVGDTIRSNDDVVTIQVESAYIQNLPFRLTGSKDVIIFADVWEDAAMGFTSSSSLTSIVYVGPNQKVPGRLNFRDMLAYGPTKFKGHPLRVRFTMMVLQKNAADRNSSAIDIISSFAAVAQPQYSAISSEVAKVFQGILRAQPDIKFFDFDATFLSDDPEALIDIIPETARAQSGQPSTTLRSGSTGADRIHWLRYGRYALVETESHDGQRSAVVDLTPESVTIEDGWLRDRNGPLATSYIVFRITPRQLDQRNDVLRAASDANLKLLESLRRSDTEIASALQQIQTSATNLQSEVLRARAESLANRIVRDAQNKGQSPKEALDRDFVAKWNDQIRGISADRKTVADQIGSEVKGRWLAKPGVASATSASVPWLSLAANRETLRSELVGKAISVAPLTFKIDQVPAVTQSSPGADKPFDTVEVRLSATGNLGAKVAKDVVEREIAAQANTIVDNKAAEKGTVKNVKITNEDDATLKPLWK